MRRAGRDRARGLQVEAGGPRDGGRHAPCNGVPSGTGCQWEVAALGANAGLQGALWVMTADVARQWLQLSSTCAALTSAPGSVLPLAPTLPTEQIAPSGPADSICARHSPGATR